MALTKTVDGMGYEKAGTKKVVDGRGVMRREYKKSVERQSTFYTLWLLVVKHRVGLFIAGDVILVMNTLVPSWFDMLVSIFRG